MSPGRVLVVDDEPDYRSLMRAHLERREYQVATAGNGREALQVLNEEGPFHVLVADLMMPKMDGLELLRRAKEVDPDIEVIVISGVGTLESAISSMRMGGAYDYLPKPLDAISDLSLAVGRAAEHRRFKVERAELQAQVAAERERLQTVIENTSDALISAEADDLIAVANPAAVKLFEGESLVDSPALRVLPGPVSTLLENWLHFRPGLPTITELRWPEGQVHMVSLTPVGADRVHPGWVMILRDVTRIRELQRMRMQLLAQAADGLRSPLAQAFETLLELNELPEEGDERFTSAVQRGMDSLGQIRSWTEEVLMLVAIEAGHARLGEPRPLANLVSELETNLDEEVFQGKELQLELELEVEDGPELAESAARRLLHHLIRQAAWRSEVGGQLRVELEQEDGQTWLKVHDRGPAMMNGSAPALLDDFVGEAGQELEGIALSLAMIKTTVDALKGQLWMWSAEGGGNTMAVSFPRATVKVQSGRMEETA
ncbi:MAG: response regulator [Anaerolineales bacterium]